MSEKPTYFPGQDYPDREEWLSKRHTPKGARVSLFYDPDRLVAGNRERGVRQGRFNPGVNNMKRGANKDPEARRKLMELRRQVQRQGHVTIDKNLRSK